MALNRREPDCFRFRACTICGKSRFLAGRSFSSDNKSLAVSGLQSLRGDSKVIVGRGFSHDINLDQTRAASPSADNVGF